jgi:hypothetical protein
MSQVDLARSYLCSVCGPFVSEQYLYLMPDWLAVMIDIIVSSSVHSFAVISTAIFTACARAHHHPLPLLFGQDALLRVGIAHRALVDDEGESASNGRQQCDTHEKYPRAS